MNSKLVRIGTVWIALSLGWIGCGPPPATEAGGAASGSDGPPDSQVAAETEEIIAPEFTLSTPDGEQVSLSDTAGKVRLVDFWATWCAPCRDEIPFLNELQAKYGPQGFEIIAISDADESAEIVAEFMVEHGVTYTSLLGTADVSTAYGVYGLPAAYLVDADGRVVDSFLGPKPVRPLESKIEALLTARPAT